MRYAIRGFAILLVAFFATPIFADMMDKEYAVESRLATKTLLLDVARIERADGVRLLAVGEHGHIVYSDDAGETWAQSARVETRNTLTSVYFPTAEIGYAVGHDATVLKTEDGGVSWKLHYQDTKAEAPLLGVYFTDANRGVAVGAFSLVLETQDGGKTWTQRPLDPNALDDFHLNDMFADKSGHIYIPAEFGTVYKSTDAGRTFRALQTPYEGSFWGGMTLRSGDILIWGMRGNVYRSSDAGKSWQKAQTGTDRSVSGGVQLKDGRIVLAGLSGAVLQSADNGRSFKETVRSDRLSFATLVQKDSKRVILFGPAGISGHDLSE